ncbi:putative Sortilin-related receptor [Hypsibius exemplaris]|uniref:Sortilin-related receptor n=1 Tax=Hypsibius exemplaris TaxID=2072580 RepID=A0A1W0XED9_HYPEX|nr:putative Sortilin-related receptor [Hypsibius exemplaris]
MAVLFRLVIFAFSIFFVPIMAGKNLIVPSREAESAGVHAINALDVGYLPEEDGRDLDRSKRATSMRSIFAPFRHPLNMTLDTEIVSSFDTTDRNDQMKLVYPGNGADLVFAFTYMLDYSKNFTSSLFLSRDSGRTFTDVTATLLKLPNGGGIGKVYSCLRTPASSQRYALVDVEHQVLFVTTDGFRNVLPRRTPFRSTEMSLDPRNPDVVFARENDGKKPLLWVSMNFGLTWEVAEQYIDSVVVGSEDFDAALDGKSTLFALRAKPNGKFSVLRSESYFLNDKKTDVMIESRGSSAKNAGLKLWMSYQRKPFQLANFGTDKPVVDYFVSNATKFGQAVIAVTFDDKRTMCTFARLTAPTSTVPGQCSVLPSAAGIGRFSIWKAMWNNSKPFSEIYRVKGLHGVYIASQLVVDDATSYMGNSVTKITYDNARNQQTFFSSHHAPGLIIGAGVIERNTADAGGTTNAIFITTDGGHRWRETLQGVYHFAELLYTTDEGANWKGVKIADQRVRILSVLTEPGERQTVFSLFDTLKNESDLRHEWVIITVNLTSVFNVSAVVELLSTKCGRDGLQTVTLGRQALAIVGQMGQKVCDLGYVPLNNSTILTCVKDPGFDPTIATVCGRSRLSPGGCVVAQSEFRKIPMNHLRGRREQAILTGEGALRNGQVL